jgi:hypothetical protein
VRSCTTLLTISFLVSSGPALTPRFNSGDVVRQARSAGRASSAVSCEPSVLDSGEFLIDTSVTFMSAPGGQYLSAVAFDGENFLVVWEDSRYGRDVYGARVTPQGEVLDPVGFVISHSANSQYWPAVGFDGENFLVVWEDHDRGGNIHISGARVTPEAAVLDTADIAIARAAGGQRFPDLAFDGASFLVVWEDSRNGGSDVYGARVTPQGEVLDTSGIAITRASDYQGSPAVAFDGSNLLVVWGDARGGVYSDVYGARVTPEGEVLDTAGFVISHAAGDQGAPAVGFDGETFLAVWEDSRSDRLGDVYGARITPEGAVLDTAGIVIAHENYGQGSPAVCAGGPNFLVFWDDIRNRTDNDIYAARVTAGGAVLDTLGIGVLLAAGGQGRPAVTFDGANFLAVWEDGRGSGTDIFGTRVTPAGTALDSSGFDITLGADDQSSPAVAFDGANILVVWEDHRGDSSFDIDGALVTPEGTVLDPGVFVIGREVHDPAYSAAPAVGFDGANYLVVWGDTPLDGYWHVYGARVTPQGEVLDTAAIAISEAAGHQRLPAVDFDGANFLVVWEDSRSGNYNIYGARVSPQGVVLDTSGLVICQAARYQGSAAVGFDGENFLVTWDDSRSGSEADIYGARVTPEGLVLDTAGFAVSQAAYIQEFPALDFDGENFLVVWQDYGSEGYSHVYGARVTPEGKVLDADGIAIGKADGRQELPTVGFDGENQIVLWEDSRNNTDFDVYGARVDPDGQVFDLGPVIDQPADQSSPALCRVGTGRMFPAYQGWARALNGRNYNAYRIWGLATAGSAIGEVAAPKVRQTGAAATVVRGVLLLPAAKGDGRMATGVLVDALGRKVIDLLSGANDVHALAPGVYFVRGPKTEDGRPAAAVRKVVVTR